MTCCMRRAVERLARYEQKALRGRTRSDMECLLRHKRASHTVLRHAFKETLRYGALCRFVANLPGGDAVAWTIVLSRTTRTVYSK